MSKGVLIADSPSGTRVLASDWVALNRAVICLDCETVFVISTACPACASKNWALLGPWLREKGDGR